MLMACDVTGGIVHASASLIPREFFCIYCKGSVFLRKGEVNRPHFAHHDAAIILCSEIRIDKHNSRLLKIPEHIKNKPLPPEGWTKDIIWADGLWIDGVQYINGKPVFKANSD